MMTNPFDEITQKLAKIDCQLQHITSVIDQSADPHETDKLLSIKEAATFLGLKERTLYVKVQKAEIPVCKRGKRLYFSTKDLTEWIKAGRKKTVIEISREADNFISNRGGYSK